MNNITHQLVPTVAIYPIWEGFIVRTFLWEQAVQILDFHMPVPCRLCRLHRIAYNPSFKSAILSRRKTRLKNERDY